MLELFLKMGSEGLGKSLNKEVSKKWYQNATWRARWRVDPTENQVERKALEYSTVALAEAEIIVFRCALHKFCWKARVQTLPSLSSALWPQFLVYQTGLRRPPITAWTKWDQERSSLAQTLAAHGCPGNGSFLILYSFDGKIKIKIRSCVMIKSLESHGLQNVRNDAS